MKRDIEELKKNTQPVISAPDYGVDFRNLQSFIEVVSVVPTHTPNSVYDQVKIYASGAVYRHYAYDYKGGTWRFVTLT